MKTNIQSLLSVLVWFGGVQLAFAPVLFGSLQVTILPPGVVTAGAMWQVDGGPLQNSGATVTVPVGSHTVAFTAVNGWTTPTNEVVNIIGGTKMFSGTYVQLQGPALTVALTTSNTVLVSWPSPSTGWNLQQNTNLATATWVASPAPTDNGVIKYINVNPPAGGNLFFRLEQP